MANILQILAQKMGKSTDEVLEALGKKAATTGEEVSEAATMANLQREAADAAVPMGSGKNLDALQSASDDIATANKTAELQKGALNAPYVDAERNINNANLGLSYDDAPAAQYKVPAPDGIKASQAAPASLADTASKLQGSVNIDRMDPRLKGVAAALGLGGLGYGMMGGEESPQIPFAPNAKQEVPPTAPDMITPVKRAASSAIAAPKSDSLDFKALENTFDKGMAGLPQEPTEEIAPVSEQPDYSSLMREAQQSSNQNDFYNHLLRSGNQAGAAIASLGAGSQVKADYSGVDALEKTAGKPVSDIKGLMETKSSEQKLKAAQEELSDDAKMRDPNSEVSKLTAELAAKAGLIKPGQVMSAQALKNSGVNIGNLLSTIEAGKNRAVAAQMAKEDKDYNRDLKRSDEQKKLATLDKKQIERINEFDSPLSNVRTLTALLGNNDNFVGPIDALTPKMIGSDELNTFHAAVGRMQDAYRHLITGAGAGNVELAKLESRMPNTSDSPSSFKAKAKQFEEELTRQKSIYLKNLERGGKNIDEFADSTDSQQGLTTPVGYTDAQERAIQHVMSGNNVDRNKAINAMKKAGKL